MGRARAQDDRRWSTVPVGARSTAKLNQTVRSFARFVVRGGGCARPSITVRLSPRLHDGYAFLPRSLPPCGAVLSLRFYGNPRSELIKEPDSVYGGCDPPGARRRHRCTTATTTTLLRSRSHGFVRRVFYGLLAQAVLWGSHGPVYSFWPEWCAERIQ